MLRGYSFENGETLLNSCCGSGIFLLVASAPDTKQLFETDIDPTAVMIGKLNVLIKYCDVEFIPQVYICGFCDVGDREGFLAQVKRFDYVVTNQPWDAKTWATGEDSFTQIFKAAFSYLPEP